MITFYDENTSFNHNNWLKNSDNIVLNVLDKKCISMYLGKKGDINYRLSSNESFISTKDYKTLENIFKNISGIDIDLSDFYSKKKLKNVDDLEEKAKIILEDLKLVTDEIFDPFSKEEFILKENGTYTLNMFRPTLYILLNSSQILQNYNINNSVIFRLISHLSNYNLERIKWIINWLAYFFQELKKSQVALVLLGVQGAGKGIFFNEVIKPLFGEGFVKTINDKSLDTRFLGSLVENTMFFNLDEISANKSQKNSIKNFLKALVTNASITAEKKYKNMDKEIPIFGQVLITSNELYALEIEPSDRRFTVFNTGGNLAHCNFLGFGSYESLSNAIKNDLEQFAVYLKSIQIDVQMANTALNTTEKDNLIQQYQMANYKPIKITKLQKNVIEFAEAIRCRDFNLFNTIIDENKFQLKSEIFSDLQHNIFRVENLFPAFKTLYGNRSFSTNSELLRELQKYNISLFGLNNTQIYTVNNEQKYFFNLIQLPIR
ncbi:primase-helicase family protein [Aliarcobacter butzleri]|uniref:primase-helicase family protein n=1 Tax=Aliarcobacter butzleri TaxID=28197 RepID=UPI002B247F95|nr:primase-helicase family protein [Aliarcobacter butzleri]